MNRVLRLWSVDIRQSWRDPITVMVFFIPLIIGLVMRFALPLVLQMLPAGVDITPYYTPAMGVLILMPGLMTGMISCFLMLDERDEGTLTAIQVTPLRKTDYLAYRLLSPVTMSFVLSVLLVRVAGVVNISSAALIVAALLASLSAPLWAGCILMLAENKIEGMAIMKLLSLLSGLPLVALFIPARFLPILWPFPLYWPFHYLMSAVNGSSIMLLTGIAVAGVACHALYIWVIRGVLIRKSM